VAINGLKGHKEMRQDFESRFFDPPISQKMAQQPQIAMMNYARIANIYQQTLQPFRRITIITSTGVLPIDSSGS
jgi:hypothetical protein